MCLGRGRVCRPQPGQGSGDARPLCPHEVGRNPRPSGPQEGEVASAETWVRNFCDMEPWTHVLDVSPSHSGPKPSGEQKGFEIILSAELGVLRPSFPPVSCQAVVCVAHSWEEMCGAGVRNGAAAMLMNRSPPLPPAAGL